MQRLKPGSENPDPGHPAVLVFPGFVVAWARSRSFATLKDDKFPKGCSKGEGLAEVVEHGLHLAGGVGVVGAVGGQEAGFEAGAGFVGAVGF